MVKLLIDEGIFSNDIMPHTLKRRARIKKIYSNLSVNGDHFKTSEVVVNNEVCGIEIQPCNSDSLSTLSTAPMSSDESGSWSLSNKNSIDIIPDVDDQDNEVLLRSSSSSSFFNPKSRGQEIYKKSSNTPVHSNKNRVSPSKVPVRRSYINRDRRSPTQCSVKSIYKSVKREHVANKDIVLPRKTRKEQIVVKTCNECIQVAIKADSLELSTVRIQLDLSTRWKNSIRLQCTQRLIPTYSLSLCQIHMNSINFTGLSSRKAVHAADIIKVPHVAFPDTTSIVVARKLPKSLELVSRGAMTFVLFQELISYLHRIGGTSMTVSSHAYRDTVPMIGNNVKYTSYSSSFRIQLSSWRQGNEDSVRADVIRSYSSSSDLTESESDDSGYYLGSSSLCDKLVCSPNMLSSTTTKVTESSSLELDLLQDQELKAVLHITEGGDNADTLFPTFSTESLYSCDSMDGLTDELQALDNIEDYIRQELEHAESLIKSEIESEIDSDAYTTDCNILVQSVSDESSLLQQDSSLLQQDSSTDSTMMKNEKLLKIEADLRKALERADQIINQVSSEDDEFASKLPPIDEDICYMASAEIDSSANVRRRRSVRLPGTKGRKVRFASDIQQRFYVKDSPATTRNEQQQQQQQHQNQRLHGISSSASTTGNNKKTSFYGALEEAYYLFEDLMDEMGYACTRAVERNLPT